MEIFLGFCIFLLAALSYASWRMGSNTPTSRVSNVFSWVDRVGRWLMISGFGLFAVGYSFASLSILPDLFFKIAAAGYILLIVACIPLAVGLVRLLTPDPKKTQSKEFSARIASIDVGPLSKTFHSIFVFATSIVTSIISLMRRFQASDEDPYIDSIDYCHLSQNRYYDLVDNEFNLKDKVDNW